MTRWIPGPAAPDTGRWDRAQCGPVVRGWSPEQWRVIVGHDLSWVRLAAYYPARRRRAQGCGLLAAAEHWSLDFWDIA